MNKKDEKYDIKTAVREVNSDTYKGVEEMLEADERWFDEEESGLEFYVRQEGGRLKRLIIKKQ